MPAVLPSIAAEIVQGVPAFTVIALAETVPKALVTLAVILELPAVTPIARPDAPFQLMLTTDEFEALQVTDPVTFCMLLSVRVPVAVNCTVVP